MGWGIVALIAFVVLFVLLATWGVVTRARRRRSALDEWPSASVGDLSKPPATGPAEMFDPRHGFGGIENHHGDQRPFGGYGSDTEPLEERQNEVPPRADERERPPDDRSHGTAA